MEEIREFERETQLLLQRKMGLDDEDEDEDGKIETISVVLNPSSNFVWFLFFLSLYPFTANATDLSASKHSSQFQSIEKTEDTPMFPKKLPEPPQLKEHPPSIDSSEGEDDVVQIHTKTRKERSASGQLSQLSRTKHGLHSPAGSMHSFDLQVLSYSCFFLFFESLRLLHQLLLQLILWNGFFFNVCSSFKTSHKTHTE